MPVGPTGSYDIIRQALANQLAKRLGQTVVVENRPGAGTVVRTQAFIQSPADGYTLLVGGLRNIVFNVGLYNKPPYDPLKDLVPGRACLQHLLHPDRQQDLPARFAERHCRGGEKRIRAS